MKKSSNCGSEATEHASNKNKNRFSRDHFCSPIVPGIWKGGRCCPRIHNLSDDPIISVNWYCRRSEYLISTDDDAASLVASAKAGKALRGNITCMHLGSKRHLFLVISSQTDTFTSYCTDFRNFFPHVPKVPSADCLRCLSSRVSCSRRVAVGQFQFPVVPVVTLVLLCCPIRVALGMRVRLQRGSSKAVIRSIINQIVP